jgi:plastocyanin
LNQHTDGGVKQVMENSPDRGGARQQLALRVAGAALLAATGAIHLDLYLTSYRNIPTIGWLFLLQVIAAFLLAAGVLATRGPLVPAAGAGFAVATLGGYLLSLWIGLFGFREVRTTAGIVAGLIEIAAFATLATLVLVAGPAQAGPAPAGPAPAGPAPAEPAQPSGLGAALGRLQGLSSAQRVLAGRIVAGLAAVALVVLGVSVAGAGGSGGAATASGSPPPGTGTVLMVTIKNFQFSPANPHVSPGERIEVKNLDPVAHSLTSGPAAKFAKFFSTGLIQQGQVKFIVAPKQPGAYPFYCVVHHFMTGMMVVGHSSANAAALAAFRAGLRAHPRSYCGRLHAAVFTTAARRTPAGRLASRD